MKYLLIVHDVYQDDNEFPLGPAYLASILRQNGHDVDVLCMDVYHQQNSFLAKYITTHRFDVIGVGFLAARFTETVLPLCKTINSVKGNAKLVLGGHCPSAIPDYVLNKTNADVVIVGEAERVISNIYNKEGVVYSPPYINLDDIPFPAWDLFPMNKYTTCKRYPGQNELDKSIAIISSRGCVNNCSFCYRIVRNIRLRKIPQVVQEMKLLHDTYGVKYFELSDECFIMKKKRLEEFNQQLQENNLSINYWCAARVKPTDEETLQLLKQGGCKFINYGFESMDEDVLKLMGKNTTPEDNEHAAKLTKEAGIHFGLNFIWGLPGDTEESLSNNVKFIKKHNTCGQLRTIRPVTPYPGSPLYYKAINDGLLKGPADFFNKFKNSDLVTVNFTNIPTSEMHNKLYLANCDLIDDYVYHTSEFDLLGMKDKFHRLYFEGDFGFRGARHYEK